MDRPTIIETEHKPFIDCYCTYVHAQVLTATNITSPLMSVVWATHGH